MPQLDQHQSSTAVKCLLVGHSGSGKTGLLGTLANAGYRLFIEDFDNGLDVLMDPAVIKPENRKNVFYKTFTDKLGARGIPTVPPSAALNAMNALNNWIETGEDGKSIAMGSVYTWGPKDVVVIDSLTLFGNSILRGVLSMVGRPGGPPQIQDWGEAMRQQEAVIEQLYAEAVKCNVIVTAHIILGDDPNNPSAQKGYPSALGNKLPPKIGSYFNTILQCEKLPGIGNAAPIRQIRTQASHNMELKNSKPSMIGPIMPPDLAAIFSILKGESNAANQTPASVAPSGGATVGSNQPAQGPAGWSGPAQR